MKQVDRMKQLAEANSSWLNRRFGGTEYLSPEYYAQILKPYCFKGVSDLGMFRAFLDKYDHNVGPKILELGSGSGRATDVLVKHSLAKNASIELLDLSAQMLDASIRKYGVRPDFKYIHADTINYLLSNRDSYDLIFSLWSFSHSVHQTLHALGESKGCEVILAAMKNLFTRSLSVNGRAFIVHFDALSEEQIISLSIRRTKYPFFVPGQQSPSKKMLDQMLIGLSKQGLVRFRVLKHTGDAIKYSSINEALEIFFNFHMECEFNQKENISDLLHDVKQQLLRFRDDRGSIRIKPKCFVYEVTRTK